MASDDHLLERDGAIVTRSPWGDEDEVGRLNLMTVETRAAVLGQADARELFDLSVTYFVGMPSWTRAGDPGFEKWMTHTPQGTVNEQLNGLPRRVLERYSYSGDAISLYTHCGTHIDALNHRGFYGMCWNGWNAEEHLGSRGWLRAGVDGYPAIVARGVLLDVATTRGEECLPDSYAVTARDLQAAAAAHDVQVRHGDVVLVRTGRMRHWPDPDAYMLDSPGLGLEAARYLCDEAGAMCVGTDTIAFEVLPPERSDEWMPVHSYMLATAGAPILEVVNLEELARAQVYEFAFIGLTLKIAGATGAPIRAVAMPFLPDTSTPRRDA